MIIKTKDPKGLTKDPRSLKQDAHGFDIATKGTNQTSVAQIASNWKHVYLLESEFKSNSACQA